MLSIDPNQWAHKNPAAIETERRKSQEHHAQEAYRFLMLAAFAKENHSFGEAVALERQAEKHRILALS